MPRIAYEQKTFSPARLGVIANANAIITEYQAQGFSLTLRQLYYQFVARGLIANRQTEYKRLGEIINDARLAGMIDWLAIEDRTRWLRETDYDQGDPDTWLARAAEGFTKSYWDDQPYAIEVWIEKDALVGVVQAACDPLFVPYFACRGYVSQSEVWAAAQRMLRHIRAGKQVVLLHLGDHDPSGIDMTRDLADRLFMFIGGHLASDRDAETIRRGDVPLDIRRIALNMDQVEQHQPPPNPAKLSDSRAEGYIARWGDESWELDALDPTTLATLITDQIDPLIDRDLWAAVEATEEEGRDRLRLVASNWQRAVDYLNGEAS